MNNYDNEIKALESAVQGDAIFAVHVASPTLRAIFARIHELEDNERLWEAMKSGVTVRIQDMADRNAALIRQRDVAREALRPFAEIHDHRIKYVNKAHGEGERVLWLLEWLDQYYDDSVIGAYLADAANASALPVPGER